MKSKNNIEEKLPFLKSFKEFKFSAIQNFDLLLGKFFI